MADDPSERDGIASRDPKRGHIGGDSYCVCLLFVRPDKMAEAATSCEAFCITRAVVFGVARNPMAVSAGEGAGVGAILGVKLKKKVYI